jgi:hypothetical protein
MEGRNMSVVVRMEMPKNCAVCPFVTEYSRCVFLGMYAIDEERRVDNCPIICSLPEGHGRLVDADALDKHVYNDIPISVFGSVKKMASVRQIIEDAPTIVPAEAERSET